MLWNYLTLLKDIQWGDIMDIVVASGLIWIALHALRTERTRRIGFGLLLYSGIMLTANMLELKLTVWILQGVTAVVVLIVVVVYQNELRRLLEKFPSSLYKQSTIHLDEYLGQVELLSQALEALSADRRGALLILPGNARLDGVITDGTPLDGQLSKSLLLSIFDPNSPGHDGALVIRGGRVERFGSHLPLSAQDEQLKQRGTRHAAALGLSEHTDAMVLIVSEETGRISVAKEGRLHTFLEPESWREEITHFMKQHRLPTRETDRLHNPLFWAGIEGMCALLAATTLWLVLVPGSVVQTSTYEVAIEVQNISGGYSLSEVSPAKVAVTLSGQRRDLFKVDPADLLIRLDGTLTRFGRQTYPITSAHLLLPPNVEIADLVPDQVRVFVRKSD